jgi:hypothetical protein
MLLLLFQTDWSVMSIAKSTRQVKQGMHFDVQNKRYAQLQHIFPGLADCGGDSKNNLHMA